MSIRAIIRRYRDRPLGQSLVEFALILPVFLVIVSTAVDLGRIAYARVTIANVAREASFQAAQTPTAYQAGQPCDPADPDANRVICRAILESTGSVVTVMPADIALTCDPTCTEGLGNTVTVTATGRFNLLTPVMAVFFGGTTITFSSSATNQISTLPPTTVSVTPPPPTAPPTPDPSATATAVPTATPVPDCSGVSAGFSYVTIPPDDNVSPVTVSVTDSTTWNTACSTVWAWSWGDGVTSYGRLQPPHVYLNAGPGNKRYILSLTVTSGTFTTTVGGYAITVKP